MNPAAYYCIAIPNTTASLGASGVYTAIHSGANARQKGEAPYVLWKAQKTELFLKDFYSFPLNMLIYMAATLFLKCYFVNNLQQDNCFTMQ